MRKYKVCLKERDGRLLSVKATGLARIEYHLKIWTMGKIDFLNAGFGVTVFDEENEARRYVRMCPAHAEVFLCDTRGWMPLPPEFYCVWIKDAVGQEEQLRRLRMSERFLGNQPDSIFPPRDKWLLGFPPKASRWPDGTEMYHAVKLLEEL